MSTINGLYTDAYYRWLEAHLCEAHTSKEKAKLAFITALTAPIMSFYGCCYHLDQAALAFEVTYINQRFFGELTEEDTIPVGIKDQLIKAMAVALEWLIIPFLSLAKGLERALDLHRYLESRFIRRQEILEKVESNLLKQEPLKRSTSLPSKKSAPLHQPIKRIASLPATVSIDPQPIIFDKAEQKLNALSDSGENRGEETFDEIELTHSAQVTSKNVNIVAIPDYKLTSMSEELLKKMYLIDKRKDVIRGVVTDKYLTLVNIADKNEQALISKKSFKSKKNW